MNQLKNKITKIEESLNETVKHCLVKYVQFPKQEMSYMACYWTCPL